MIRYLVFLVLGLFGFYVCVSDVDAEETVVGKKHIATRVVYTSEELEKIPRVGRVVLSDENTPVLDIGRRFLGEEFVGRLTVVNGSTTDIEIDSVATSCGCTAAYPISRRIEHGDECELVCSVKPSRAGSFTVSLYIKSGDKQWGVRLVGKALPPFEPVSSELRYGVEETDIEVSLKVNKKLSADSKLSVDLGTLRKEVALIGNSVGTFSLPVSSLPVSGRVEVSPVMEIDGEQVVAPPISWRLLRKDHLELITSNIFVRATDDSKKFRLLFRGDVRGLPDTCQGSVCDESFTADVKSSGSTAIVTCECSAELEPCGLGTLRVFGKTFQVALLNGDGE